MAVARYMPFNHYLSTFFVLSVCIYIYSYNSSLPLPVMKLLLCASPISGGVTALCWDPIQRVLFSGSSDHSIIMWDIGGRKGTAIELQGHKYVQSPSSCFYVRKAYGRGHIWKQTAQRVQPSRAQACMCTSVVHIQLE